VSAANYFSFSIALVTLQGVTPGFLIVCAILHPLCDSERIDLLTSVLNVSHFAAAKAFSQA
jgi:hypothetical protein